MPPKKLQIHNNSIKLLTDKISTGTPGSCHAPKDDKRHHKIAKPKEYHSNPDKVIQFVKDMEYYFHKDNVKSLTTKIGITLELITGRPNNVAYTWASNIGDNYNIMQFKEHINDALEWNNKHLDQLKEIPKPLFTSWDLFKEKFLEHWSIVEAADTAKEGLLLLVQSNINCNKYNNIFNGYFAQTQFNKAAALHLYKKGLNAWLHKKVMTKNPPPVDYPNGQGICLANWMNCAAKIEQSFQGHQHLYGKSKNSAPIPTSTPTFTQHGYKGMGFNTGNQNYTPTVHTPKPSTLVKDPNTMEIDRNGCSRSKLTCYHCQGKGHFAKNCPNLDKPKVWPNCSTKICTLYGEMTKEEQVMLKKDLGF